MKVIAMIPARYEASRFPGKLMKKIGSKTVILMTYKAVEEMDLFDEVFVVTDSDVISTEIVNNGGNIIRSRKDAKHETGSDRIAEAAASIEADIVINIQGDEPFTRKEPLEEIIKVFKDDKLNEIDVITLKREIMDARQLENPNSVKVVTDKNDFALYFSRSPIPYTRDENTGVKYFEHVGIYAFRKQALIDFSEQPIAVYEATEKIEALRHLEYGKKMKVLKTNYKGIGIDTPDDLENAIVFFNNKQ